MREILFRGFHPNENGEETITLNGKKIKGEWIEGNVFIDDKGEKAEILMGYTNYRISFDIIPETVGMFTGSTDKNGKKIFEGDIVEYTLHYMVSPSVDVCADIKWSDCYGCYIISDSTSGLCDRILCDMATETEVVGNIHDNPELLK